MTKKNPTPEIEPWDDIEEVDVSKKKYLSDKQIEAYVRGRIPQEEVITRFKKVHGDRYDYSKVEYVNTSTKVVIICPDHGEFTQKPNHHLNGQGCPKCAREQLGQRITKGKTKSLDQVLEDFRKVHGDRYDYSKVKYVAGTAKVIIICPKHGEFLKSPANHIKGQGCPECTKENVGKTISESRAKSTETRLIDFLERSREKHGDRYDYSKVVYLTSKTKVTIICPDHGEFEQTPSKHLKTLGCPICAKEITRSRLSLAQSERRRRENENRKRSAR